MRRAGYIDGRNYSERLKPAAVHRDNFDGAFSVYHRRLQSSAFI
jgi:hypothetical protein